MKKAAPDAAATPELFDGKPVLRFREESDRRNFLKMAALVGVGSSLVAATRFDPKAFALGSDDKTDDLKILNYALTLEYLEADFYAKAVQGGALSGRYQEILTAIADHETTHVKAVLGTIKQMGGTPAAKPQAQYPSGTFTDKDKLLATASTFEELGVTAYHGQVPLVKEAAVLKAAASIAGVESRHAAVLADMKGGNPFPAAFEKHMTMQQVLNAAAPFIKS